MATFKTIVRYKRADGFYQVYIRVLHRSKSGYIKTDKFVTDKQLSKSGEIKDAVINKYCAQEILRYTELVNRKDVSGYSVTELIEYLMNSDMEVCFSAMQQSSLTVWPLKDMNVMLRIIAWL